MGLGDMLQAERDSEDARRYRWLRDRIEVREVKTVAGTTRPGMEFRISGDLFGVTMRRPNPTADALDRAIDKETSAQTVSDSPHE